MSGITKSIGKVFRKNSGGIGRAMRVIVPAAMIYFTAGAAAGAFAAPAAGAGATAGTAAGGAATTASTGTMWTSAVASQGAPVATAGATSGTAAVSGGASAASAASASQTAAASAGMSSAAPAAGFGAGGGAGGGANALTGAAAAGAEGAATGAVPATASTPAAAASAAPAAAASAAPTAAAPASTGMLSWLQSNPMTTMMLGQGLSGAYQGYLADKAEEREDERWERRGLMGFDSDGNWAGKPDRGIVRSRMAKEDRPEAQAATRDPVTTVERPGVPIVRSELPLLRQQGRLREG